MEVKNWLKEKITLHEIELDPKVEESFRARWAAFVYIMEESDELWGVPKS